MLAYDASRQSAVVFATALAHALAIVSCGLRLWARFASVGKLWWDDAFALIALVGTHDASGGSIVL